MKAIESSVEMLQEEFDVNATKEQLVEKVYEEIERAGRLCYKSEDKIGDGTAKAFVDMLVNAGHNAMLEHGTVYLYDTYDVSAVGSWDTCIGAKYEKNAYSVVNFDQGVDMKGVYITTNYRVLVENNWLDDLQYIHVPEDFHEPRITVKFVCDRGISHELVRHRVFSFAQESTRYCNYSKDKFGNEITFVLPAHATKDSEFRNIICGEFKEAESYYFNLLSIGMKPQDARCVLPTALKTEIIMTGFLKDWGQFITLRTKPNAHPDIQKLANEAANIMANNNFIIITNNDLHRWISYTAKKAIREWQRELEQRWF